MCLSAFVIANACDTALPRSTAQRLSTSSRRVGRNFELATRRNLGSAYPHHAREKSKPEVVDGINKESAWVELSRRTSPPKPNSDHFFRRVQMVAAYEMLDPTLDISDP